MFGVFLVSAALAGSNDVGEGVAVGAATLGGQVAFALGGGAAGLAWGSSICAPNEPCMAGLMAIPLAGLGAVIGAPIGAGLGAHATNRSPWRAVGAVGATELGALAVSVGGLVMMSSANGATSEVGGGVVAVGAVAGFALPPFVAGIAAATGADDFRVAVLPEVGKDKAGIRLVAAF